MAFHASAPAIEANVVRIAKSTGKKMSAMSPILARPIFLPNTPLALLGKIFEIRLVDWFPISACLPSPDSPRPGI